MTTRGRVHHIAIGARNVELVARFYRDAFGLAEVARHNEASGRLRSIWLDLGDAVLMVERTASRRGRVEGVGRGPFLIAFRCAPWERRRLERRLASAGAPIESRTRHTSYARDPEKNRVAVSALRLPNG